MTPEQTEAVRREWIVWGAEQELPQMMEAALFVRDLPAGREAIAHTVADRLRVLRNADRVPLVCGSSNPAEALRNWWVAELRSSGYLPAKWLPSWWIMAQWLLPLLLDLARMFLEYINEPEES